MVMKAATVAIAIACAAGSANAGEKITDKELFQFFTNCSPLYVVMAVEGGFPKDAIRNTVESSLRSARLLAPEQTKHADLRVYANRLPSGIYLMELHFRKRLADWQSLNWPGNSENTVFTLRSTTWRKQATSDSADTSGIPTVMAKMMDDFLGEYLRINAPACEN